MKWSNSALAVIAAFAVVLAMSATAGAQDPEYQITESVIGSGGGSSSGGSYSLIGTVGQPAIGVAGGGSYFNQIGFWYQPGWILTGVEDEFLPTTFSLGQNFPNPFNPVTTFRFAVPKAARVTITLYDVAGRVVRTLADDEYEPGYHTLPLSADRLASGVYFCRMASEDFSETTKLLLLK
jgi:hypothetical protein